MHLALFITASGGLFFQTVSFPPQFEVFLDGRTFQRLRAEKHPFYIEA